MGEVHDSPYLDSPPTTMQPLSTLESQVRSLRQQVQSTETQLRNLKLQLQQAEQQCESSRQLEQAWAGGYPQDWITETLAALSPEAQQQNGRKYDLVMSLHEANRVANTEHSDQVERRDIRAKHRPRHRPPPNVTPRQKVIFSGLFTERNDDSGRWHNGQHQHKNDDVDGRQLGEHWTVRVVCVAR